MAGGDGVRAIGESIQELDQSRVEGALARQGLVQPVQLGCQESAREALEQASEAESARGTVDGSLRRGFVERLEQGWNVVIPLVGSWILSQFVELGEELAVDPFFLPKLLFELREGRVGQSLASLETIPSVGLEALA